MNIILTGSSGFIGGHLLKTLSVNNNVYCIPSNYINSNNLEILKEKNKYTNWDVFIKCGWLGASDKNNINEPYQLNNINHSINLFNFVRELGVNHIIGIGSSWEYGKYDKIITEDQIETPTNLYGLSKLTVKNLYSALCNYYNIDFAWARPFWVFGPNDKDNRLIPSIIKKCKNNENIELHPCENIINYLYIDDFCSGINTLLDNKVTGIYNICNDHSIKTKRIIETIKLLLKSTSNISYNKDYPSNFIHFWDGDCGKLKNLGWLPRVDIEDGLQKIINATI